MRDKLTFLAKFLIFSTVLFLFWTPLNKTYVLLAANTAKALIAILGWERTINIPVILAMPEAGKFSSIVPFIALVLATPKIKPREKGRIILVGATLLFFTYVVLLALIPKAVEGSWTATTLHKFLNESGKIGIPVLLWFIMTYKKETGLLRFRLTKR